MRIRYLVLAFLAALMIVVCSAAREISMHAAMPAKAGYFSDEEATAASVGPSYVTLVSDVILTDVLPGVGPPHQVARLHAGTRVELIGQNETLALVVAPNGTQGWVSKDFVRELRP